MAQSDALPTGDQEVVGSNPPLKIDFQDGRHGGCLGFLIRTILAIFDLPVTPMLPTMFRVKWPFGSKVEAKIDFQDGHLGFPIGMILANFDQQVTLMLPTKFRFKWSFGSGEEVKNRFSRWPPWPPSWISDWEDFSNF